MPKQERWILEFKDKWVETFDSDGETDEVRYRELIDFISSLLEQTWKDAYSEGYNDCGEERD